MPNRRAHDHIGNLVPKLNIRIGLESSEQIIKNLEKLADVNFTITEIDKIVNKIIKDAKFRTSFMKDYLGAAKSLVRVSPKR
ncbi:MAG: hypothetical protein GF329_00930 [Candidatus Lokiarchaeota archaeon]|nr:hypothetical protein [Candidatus Lokiarchaeota archaeon]